MTTALRRAGPLVVAALCLAPHAVGGQLVVGRVLERGGGGPVAGAMVRLRGGAADTGSGWLTAADGRFNLRAPTAGTYTVSVERIGFATTVVEGVSVAEGGIASLDVVVSAEAIELEGLEVHTAGGRCGLAADGGAAQLLWDEARKALAAATWTEREVPMRFVASVWDRQIDPRTSQILFEKLESRETIGANSVQSLPPEELVSEGYVRIDPAYSYYYAPDADVLLSDAFQDTHCFGVERAKGSPFVGLAFEPDEDRRLPDVRGVIWLDARTARLDRVEFRYTGLRVPGADRARGEVRWAELQNGRWIVAEWLIRAPMPRGLVGVPGTLRRQNADAVHEVGNVVELVVGDGFEWRPDVAPGTIHGLVYDSVTRAPLAGAEVRVAGRPLRARADLDGRFTLPGVPAGLHRVTFAHPALDGLGVTPGWQTVDLAAGGTAEVALVVPSWETLLARSCGGGGRGAVVGVVRNRSGERVPGAVVEALDVRAADGSTVSDVADRRGAFVLCGLPIGVVRVAAERGPASARPVETRSRSDAWVQADLVLEPGATTDAAHVPGALRPALIGTVLAHSDRRPLADVSIELLDEEGELLAGVLTDEEGGFRVVLDRGARVHLRITGLGVTTAVSEVVDVTEGTRRLEITLPEEAIEIEPVVVVVEGREPKLDAEGFYGRAVTTSGTFIRRDDVEAVAPARTSDLLGRAPGIRVTTDAFRADLRRRVTFQRLALAGGARCWPTIYIDGELVRIGGSREESEAPTIEGIEPVIEEGSDLPSLDELVPPHEILAVELYDDPGQVPRRFVGLGTHCGVIVVWTTRRAGPG